MHFVRQFGAFFGVGVAAVIVHYGLLYLLVEAYFYDKNSAAAGGYLAGGVVSYVLNRIFTYQAGRSNLEAGWRFAVVAVVGAILTWLLMKFFNGWLGWHYMVAQVVITGLVLFWSFLAHKYWSFKDQS
jgi:putative flippase GtrA